LPTIAALSSCHRKRTDAQENAAAIAGVTRKSKALQSTSRLWGGLIWDALHSTEGKDDFVAKDLLHRAKQFGMRSIQPSEEMTACYLGQSFPALLNMIAKYIPSKSPWKGLLANANVGGENVHRGSVMGAILGARAGMDGIPTHMQEGLYKHEELQKEMNEFVHVVFKQQQ